MKKDKKDKTPKKDWREVVAARSQKSTRYLGDSVDPDPPALGLSVEQIIEEDQVLTSEAENKPKPTDKIDFSQPWRMLLPNLIQELATQAGYSSKFCQDNLEILYNVGSFLHKDEFPRRPPAYQTRETSPLYCDPDKVKGSLKLVFPTPKPTKKMFKYAKIAGEGGFGIVMCARAKVIPKGASQSKGKKKVKEVAVKKLLHNTSREQRQNLDELAFLATLDHPNIVSFFYALHVKENTDSSGKILDELWIVTEFLLGGTLDQAARYKSWPQNSVAFVAWQILSALEYLHSLNIAHRDLKSTNVMMSVKGEIKLIDFGLCCEFPKGPRVQICGTSHWIPPEMIKAVPHHTPVDIWSLGVCILELFILGPPHKDQTFKCMVNAATVGFDDQIPAKHPQLTSVGQDFIRSCLVVDHTKRPTAKNLLKHDFITKNAREDKGGIVKILANIFVATKITGGPGQDGVFLF